jgi:hypothetical protein
MSFDVLAGLVGVVLGWLLNWLPARWSARPRVKAQLVQLLTFPALAGADGRWRMVMPDSSSDAVMFWAIDLIVQNQSSEDDAVTEIYCDLQQSHNWACTRVGRRFFGQNLHGHSLHHLHLVFNFERVNFGVTEAWSRDRAASLRLSTLNGPGLSLGLDPGGTGVAMSPGEDMSALVAVE